ncbi:MAG: helix-turn-helix domain containing protein [Azospirillaceae bacterium]|nr:helix-turn-helix domain containing protein [Azospirillaceae bacterium]
MQRIQRAFLDYGYSDLTMVELAEACGFTRRALYHYFSNKEAAFQATIRHENAQLIETGMAAGDKVRQAGGSALDIMTAIMDARYGYTRRVLNQSPHIIDLNAEAFKRGRAQMIEAAVNFQARLAALLLELQAEGRLALTGEFTVAQVAQALADGARAVNQSLPPFPSEQLTARYRAMCQVILYGCAKRPATD